MDRQWGSAFRKSGLILITGRPHTGKTSLSLRIASLFPTEQVFFICLEYSESHITELCQKNLLDVPRYKFCVSNPDNFLMVR